MTREEVRRALVICGVILSIEDGNEEITEAIKDLASKAGSNYQHVTIVMQSLRPLIDDGSAFIDDVTGD